MKYRAWCVLLLLPCPALPCSRCVNVRQSPTFRSEAAQPSAHLILHGTLENARLRNDSAVAGAGATDFRVVEVLKADSRLPLAYRKKMGDLLVLPAYFPIEDPKKPPHFLSVCSVTREGISAYRYIAINSSRMLDYVKATLALPANDTRGNVGFFFQHLANADPQVATEAFLERSRAYDRE